MSVQQLASVRVLAVSLALLSDKLLKHTAVIDLIRAHPPVTSSSVPPSNTSRFTAACASLVFAAVHVCVINLQDLGEIQMLTPLNLLQIRAD